MANQNKKFLIYKVLGLITDHPKDTINIKEVMKSLPSGTKEYTVRSYFRKMFVRHGVVVKVSGERPVTYRIIRRRKINLEWPGFERKKAKVKQAKKEGTMFSEAELGRSVLAKFYKVNSERHELRKENKYLVKKHIRIMNEVHDRVRKENKEHSRIVSALENKVRKKDDDHSHATKQLHNRIREQNKIISALRNRLSELEGKVFRLEDITGDEKEGENPG